MLSLQKANECCAIKELRKTNVRLEAEQELGACTGQLLVLRRRSPGRNLRLVLPDQLHRLRVFGFLAFQGSSASWRTLQEFWIKNRPFSVTFEVAKRQ